MSRVREDNFKQRLANAEPSGMNTLFEQNRWHQLIEWSKWQRGKQKVKLEGAGQDLIGAISIWALQGMGPDGFINQLLAQQLHVLSHSSISWLKAAVISSHWCITGRLVVSWSNLVSDQLLPKIKIRPSSAPCISYAPGTHRKVRLGGTWWQVQVHKDSSSFCLCYIH